MSKFNMKNEYLSLNELDKLQNNYNKDDKNVILRHALSKTSIPDVIYVSESEHDLQNKFSIDLKTMNVCNQKQSGRCWIFAGLNILREIIGKKLNVEQFELSQNYVAFFDKLEKINFTLSSVMELLDKEHDDRTLMHILTNGVGDGGQWDMFANLVKKYGVCPKNAMVETYQSSGTRESDVLINSMIRKFAADASKLYKEEKYDQIKEMKDELIQKSYNLLANCFGVPPKTFNLEYVDKDNKYHLVQNLTPKQFFDEFIGSEIDEYQSITNAPTKDKPYVKTFTIKYLGNVIEGKKVVHLNLTMDRIKEIIINQLSNNEPVWFGSDVSYYRNRTTGVWDTLSYDYMSAFGLDVKFSKEDMLNYFNSAMNHAMVITGVNLVNGKANKWKIENSWGDDIGNKGYFIMSSDFFDRFVYQAVVNKKYLDKEELEALEKEPVELKPWDPMGTLA